MIRAIVGATLKLTVSGSPYDDTVVPPAMLPAGTLTYFCAHADHRATRFASIAALTASHVTESAGDHVCGRFADGSVTADSPRGTGIIKNLLTTLD